MKHRSLPRPARRHAFARAPHFPRLATLAAAGALLASPAARADIVRSGTIGWDAATLYLGYAGTGPSPSVSGSVAFTGGTQRAGIETTVVMGYDMTYSSLVSISGRNETGTASMWTVGTIVASDGTNVIEVSDYGRLLATTVAFGGTSASSAQSTYAIRVRDNGFFSTGSIGLGTGGPGTGTMSILSGGRVRSTTASVGSDLSANTSSVTIDGAASFWMVTGQFGMAGTSTLTVSGGALAAFASGTLQSNIGSGAASNSAILVEGEESRLSFNAKVTLGTNTGGRGSITLADGGALTGSTVELAKGGSLRIGAGELAGIVDAFTISGLYVADKNYGTVVFDHRETGYTFANGLGAAAKLTGYLNVSYLQGVTRLVAGNDYFGVTTISGGTLILDNPTVVSSYGTGNSSVVIGAAGTLKIGTGGTTGSVADSATIANAGHLIVDRSDTLYTMFQAISGAGDVTYRGSGTISSYGNSAYTGATYLENGVFLAQSTASLGSGGAIYFNGGTLAFGASYVGGPDLSTRFSSDADQRIRISIDGGGTGRNFAGNLGSVGGTFTKLGSGTVTLSGNNTYDGGTTVEAGKLVANSATAFGSGGVRINAGVADLNGRTLTNAFDVRGGLLTGVGGTGALSLGAGAVFNPGSATYLNAITRFTAGNTTIAGGATYAWVMVDGSGAAGSAYATLHVTGTLALGATAENKILVSLTSYAGSILGAAASFDTTVDHSYTLISTTAGVTGFDSGAFAIDGTGFANALQGGAWAVALGNGGKDLNLNFVAAVPEPATYGLAGGLGLPALAALRRRRKK